MYLLHKITKYTSTPAQACQLYLCGVSGYGSSGNQLLAAANANNSDNSGVRCANTNNRGANTNANYGFPLLRLFGFPFGGCNATDNKIKPNCRYLATKGLPLLLRMLTPIQAYAKQAWRLAKEYEVRQRLVEGFTASANVLFSERHKHLMQVRYGA